MAQSDERRQRDDIFDARVRDHRRISELLWELEISDEPSTRSPRFVELHRELVAHTAAEEAVVYERLARSTNESLRTLVRYARRVQGVIERQVAELECFEGSPAVWGAKVRLLRDTVEQHLDEEEGAEFALARKDLGAEERIAMAHAFAAEKRGVVWPGAEERKREQPIQSMGQPR